MMIDNTLIEYIKDVEEALHQVDVNQIDTIAKVLYRAKNIFVFGNGGSTATAEHLAVDLIKFGGKKVWTLSNISMLTMIANDYGYDNSFSWMVENLGEENDVLLCFSTSGTSKNIIQLLNLKKKSTKILITGLNGLESSLKFSNSIVVKTRNIQIVEDIHLIIAHMLSRKVFALQNKGKGLKNG